MPKFNSISISGYHMQEAGANVRPRAGVHHRGRPRVRARGAQSKGLDVDAFAGRLSFFFAIGMNFYMEVAKLRAARLLWATPHAEALRAEEPAARSMLRTHCQTSGCEPHRPGPLQQRGPHHGGGDGGRRSAARSRLHTNAIRRGAWRCPTDASGAHRAEHAAHPPGGDRDSAGRSTRGAAPTSWSR